MPVKAKRKKKKTIWKKRGICLCVYSMRLGEKENLEEECCWGLKIAIFQQKKKGCCVFVYLKKTRKIRLFIEGKKKLLQTFWFDKGQLPKASFYFWWGGGYLEGGR